MSVEKISVIMSLYSEPLEWLRESIDSILFQDYKVFEFIIVNDNPQRQELDDFLYDYESRFENVKILKNFSNLGLVSSLNKAIEFSTGDFIARMDADDISLPNRFSVQLDYLKSFDFDLIGSNVQVIDELGNNMYNSNKILSERYVDAILLLGTVPLVHPTYLGKKEVFKFCRYNEQALYAEDMEFIAHARTLGYKIGNCPRFLVKYRFNQASITKSNAYISYNTALSVKASFKNFKKNGKYSFVQLLQSIDNSKVKKFNDRQIFMNFAKRELRKGSYLKGILFLFRAMLSDFSFFTLLYINFVNYYFVYRDYKK